MVVQQNQSAANASGLTADCGEEDHETALSQWTTPRLSPASEERRLAVLRSYGILDTPEERVFDDLTALAAQLCNVPIALVSLVEEDRQWFKSHLGISVCSTSREDSFCAHALAMDDAFVVPDATLDPRFAHNPLVTGDVHIRAYAGIPLVNPDGYVLGTFCVIDTVPRAFTSTEIGQLSVLARQVMSQLELTRLASSLAAEVDARRVSEEALERSIANLTAVATVVRQIQSGSDARQIIVDACRRLVGAEEVTLLESEPDGSTLKVTATTDLRVGVDRLPQSAASVPHLVLGTGESLFCSTPTEVPNVPLEVRAIIGTSAFIVMPVRSGSTIVGVLVVRWALNMVELEDAHFSVISLLANQAGVSLRQSTLISNLERMAHSDPLTGLPNRRSWDELLGVHLALSRQADQPLIVAIADLDHFKIFNDTWGHAAGDDLLRRFATAGKSALRAGDVLARWGGEEFALALLNCSDAQAAGVLDRLRRSVPQGQSCSIGYAIWDGLEDADAVMARADRALYVAKDAGRNRVVRDLSTATDAQASQPLS